MIELPDCAYIDDSRSAELLDCEYCDPSPERRLCAAVLLLAARDYANGHVSAAAWFASSLTGPWSCRWVCDMLDIDRNRLRAIIQQHRTAIASNTQPFQWVAYWLRRRVRIPCIYGSQKRAAG